MGKLASIENGSIQIFPLAFASLANFISVSLCDVMASFGRKNLCKPLELENEPPTKSRQKCRFRTFYAGIGKEGFYAKREKNSSETPGNLAGIVQNWQTTFSSFHLIPVMYRHRGHKNGTGNSRGSLDRWQTAELCI